MFLPLLGWLFHISWWWPEETLRTSGPLSLILSCHIIVWDQLWVHKMLHKMFSVAAFGWLLLLKYVTPMLMLNVILVIFCIPLSFCLKLSFESDYLFMSVFRKQWRSRSTPIVKLIRNRSAAWETSWTTRRSSSPSCRSKALQCPAAFVVSLCLCT